MLTLTAKLNELPLTDIILFIVLAAIIVIAIAIYFLIPVFNKKQYQEQRDNLRKREAAFHSNRGETVAPAEQPAAPTEEHIEPQEGTETEEK